MDENAKNILDFRLARGEISVQEYKQILETLSAEPATSAALSHAGETRQPQRSQLLLEINDELYLFDDHLEYKGRNYPFTAVSSLSYFRYSQSINYVPSSKISSFGITLEDGTIIFYSTNTILIRGKKSKMLEQAYALLQPATIQHRINRIARNLIQEGLIILPSRPKVHLYRDGTIVNDKGTRLNLKESRANNALILGMEYQSILGGASREIRPDEIGVYERPKRFGVKKIIFTLYDDQDAWKVLLDWISQPQNSL